MASKKVRRLTGLNLAGKVQGAKKSRALWSDKRRSMLSVAMTRIWATWRRERA
jgi:hypothetical protein